MSEENKNIPLDRWIIQESLQQVAKGPDAFMEWAKQHRGKIDNKFMNILRKMKEFSEKNNQAQQLKVFTLLEESFQKVLDLDLDKDITITKENFPEVWKKATGFIQTGKPQQAIRHFDAIAIYLHQNSMADYLAQMYANLGTAHAQMKSFPRAVEYQQKALEASQSNAQKEKIYANIGTIYSDMEEPKLAREHYQEAFRLSEHPAMKISHQNNIVMCYIKEQNVSQAILEQEKVIQTAKESGNGALIQDSLTRLALLLETCGETEKSKQICDEAAKFAQE